MSLLETNLKYFSDTRAALEARGFQIGRAGSFGSYEPSRVLRALVIMGVAAAGVLYLSLVVPALNRRKRALMLFFAVAALIAMMPILIGAGSKIRLAAALASANLFPALAVIGLLDLLRGRRFQKDAPAWRIIVAGLVLLGITSALSLIGASYLSGALTDTRYLLEFDIFRGIKLTFVLPMILVAVAFLQRFDIFDGQFDDHRTGVDGRDLCTYAHADRDVIRTRHRRRIPRGTHRRCTRRARCSMEPSARAGETGVKQSLSAAAGRRAVCGGSRASSGEGRQQQEVEKRNGGHSTR